VGVRSEYLSFKAAATRAPVSALVAQQHELDCNANCKGPAKTRGVHHSVWQIACAAYVLDKRGYGAFTATQVINGIGDTMPLGSASFLDAKLAVTAFLESASAELRIHTLGEGRFAVPLPGDIREVSGFFNSSREEKQSRVARWVAAASVRGHTPYCPGENWWRGGALQVPYETWQSHAWLVWFNGRVGRSLGVQDFRE
jgi:hypothetical protein